MNINPFKDVTTNLAREQWKNMGVRPKDIEAGSTDTKIPYAGSDLTYAKYNETFEGDRFLLDLDNAHVGGGIRRTDFASNTSDGTKLSTTAPEGFLGTSLGAKRSHSHQTLQGQNDSAEFTGNSQRNIALVELGSGQKFVNQNLGGGDDKSVLYLNNTSGTIFIDGGEGNDKLEIHSSNSDQAYTLISNPEDLPDPNDGSEGLRIVTQRIEAIVETRPVAEK